MARWLKDLRTPWCSVSYPLGVRVPPVGNHWFRWYHWE